MKKCSLIFSVLAICFCLIMPISEAAKNSEPVLKVLVGSGSSAKITVNAACELLDTDRKKVIGKEKAGSLLTISKQGNQLLVNGKPVTAKRVEVKSTGKAIVRVNGKAYRGGMIFQTEGQKLNFINLVGLEDYIRGVVPEEMSESWPAEALKAQAVAARTFALYTKDEEKHSGYDLCSSTHCQAYGGVDSEAASVNAAVDATRGEILQYAGKVIYAAFHSDSGGYTANSEEVWGGRQPYLRSVKDDTTGAPHNKWQENYTLREVEDLLRDNGYYVGKLNKITLTPLKIGAGKTADRSESGRVQSVRFDGNKGTVTLTGNTMRSVFDLSSTLFDIRLSTEKKWGREHKIGKAGGLNIVFEGHGWGHGLGMSQWGAKIMSAKNNYQAILKHFYTKIDIRKMY